MLGLTIGSKPYSSFSPKIKKNTIIEGNKNPLTLYFYSVPSLFSSKSFSSTVRFTGVHRLQNNPSTLNLKAYNNFKNSCTNIENNPLKDRRSLGIFSSLITGAVLYLTTSLLTKKITPHDDTQASSDIPQNDTGSSQLTTLINKIKLAKKNGSIEAYGEKKLINILFNLDSTYEASYIGNGVHKQIYKYALKANQEKAIALTRLYFESNPAWQTFKDRALENEVKIFPQLAQLNIPGLVPMAMVWDKSTTSNEVMVVSKFCNQKDLSTTIKTMDPLEKIKCLRSISNTLEQLHNAGFEHGDLHHGNVLVHKSKNGEFKYYLSDFGYSEGVQRTKKNKSDPVKKFSENDHTSFRDLVERFTRCPPEPDKEREQLLVHELKMLRQKLNNEMSIAEINDELSRILKALEKETLTIQ